MRVVVVMAVLLSRPGLAMAEWQVRPFLGATFGGGTTLVADLENAVGTVNMVMGVSAGFLGDVAGFEGDVGRSPGFFQAGPANLVLRSSVTTMTGNVTMSLPRRLTQYTLRPYFVGGAGLMRASTTNALGVLQLSRNLAAVDVGGGVTGFVTDRVGVSWDVRHFRSIRGQEAGLSIGPEQLSFWRANMALAIRY